MNELIERLAREVGLGFVEYKLGEWLNIHTATNLSVEAFARAVARECAEIAEHKYLAEEVNQTIRERFGL